MFDNGYLKKVNMFQQQNFHTINRSDVHTFQYLNSGHYPILRSFIV